MPRPIFSRLLSLLEHRRLRLPCGKVTRALILELFSEIDYLIFKENNRVINTVYKCLQTDSNLKYYHRHILSVCKKLRDSSLQTNDADQYNVFMKDLKQKLLSRDPKLWNKFRKDKIGLLTNDVKFSDVSPAEAESFLSADFLNDVELEDSDEEQDYEAIDFVKEEDYDDCEEDYDDCEEDYDDCEEDSDHNKEDSGHNKEDSGHNKEDSGHSTEDYDGDLENSDDEEEVTIKKRKIMII